jgi:GAF domain-containing protein
MTTPSSPDPAERLAAAFVTLADTLRTDFDVIDLMRRLAGHCVDLLDVAGAGAMIAGPDGKLELAASSDDTMRALEQYELDIDAGPCLSAYHHNDITEVRDLDHPEQHWTDLAARARTHGYAAVHAIPMRREDQIIGVLNLYSTAPGPLSLVDQQRGQALADVATIATLQHRTLAAHATHTGQLQTAFTTRLIIEQAKGILTERHSITSNQAFDLIRRYARHHQLKIADLAHDITTGTRTLPHPAQTHRKPHRPR